MQQRFLRQLLSLPQSLTKPIGKACAQGKVHAPSNSCLRAFYPLRCPSPSPRPSPKKTGSCGATVFGFQSAWKALKK